MNPKNCPDRQFFGLLPLLTNYPLTLYPPGAKKLIGSDHAYRVRVGDYRLIYEVFDDSLKVLIIRVRHRKDVYR
jgi:mRNA interferase RelE/StbE